MHKIVKVCWKELIKNAKGLFKRIGRAMQRKSAVVLLAKEVGKV